MFQPAADRAGERAERSEQQRRVTYVDQNLDTYAVEYTYPDGTKFDFDGRCINGCKDIYSSYLHGSKGFA
ncbi:MAG TPA: hypothetical protein PLP74_19110, partial [Quisquiliibacterium sp.]|nr:hypothetical protein [Quisquiliibacterium sp.]